MNEKELLEELIKSVNTIKTDISEIKDRTLKLEITQENITNKNIQLLMEGQQLNAEKLKVVDKKLEKLDNIEASMVALEATTIQNTIKIKEKIG